MGNSVNIGTCRTKPCIILPSNAASQSLVSNLANAQDDNRSVILELNIVAGGRIKRPVNNRRNMVRVYNSQMQEVAKANASIVPIMDDGAVVGFKLVSSAIQFPNVTASYTVVWRFMATTPISEYVETSEVLTITTAPTN